MITNGWINWATRRDGIPDKVYSEPNKGLGLIGHSIVGSIEGALSRFLSTARHANGDYTAQAAASSMFLLAKSGALIQMYPVTASTWTSGGREANTSYWAIEAEGGAGPNFSEPLTDAQVTTLLALAAEFEAYTGKRVVKGTTFREHGEVAAQLGYASTACPSERYAKFYEALSARTVTAAAATVPDQFAADRERIARLEVAVYQLSMQLLGVSPSATGHLVGEQGKLPSYVANSAGQLVTIATLAAAKIPDHTHQVTVGVARVDDTLRNELTDALIRIEAIEESLEVV